MNSKKLTHFSGYQIYQDLAIYSQCPIDFVQEILEKMREGIKRVAIQLKWKGPASEHEIDSARSRIGFSLPEDFLELYRHANGLSGNLEPSGEHLIVWPIGELPELNAAYNVSDYAPGIFIFGSNGGGEAYGFDTRQPGLPVVMIPFIGMELRYARPVAPSFTEFLDALEKGIT